MKAHNNFDNLDSKLASEGQQSMMEIVRQLPEDTLSMAWRSSLNERLLAESRSRKPRFRFSFTWLAMPAASLAVAAAFATAVFLHAPASNSIPMVATPHAAASDAVAAGLFDAYRQESASREIEGAGPDTSSDVSKPSIVEVASESYGSEVDSDSL